MDIMTPAYLSYGFNFWFDQFYIERSRYDLVEVAFSLGYLKIDE